MKALNDRRFWIGGSFLIAALLVAVSWLFLISPKLSDASSLRGSAASADTQNIVLQSKLAKLKKANDNKAQLIVSLAQSLAALPTDSGLPDFTRQLSLQATANGVSLTSLAIGTISPVGPNGAVNPTPGTGSHLFAIQVTLTSDGTAKQQWAFLTAVQSAGPRRALVSSVQFAPGTSATEGSLDGASTMTTQLTIYSAPVTAAAKAQLTKQLTGDFSS